MGTCHQRALPCSPKGRTAGVLPPGRPGTPSWDPWDPPGTQNLVHDFPGSMHKSYPVFPIKSSSPVFVTFQVFPGEAISGHHLSGPVPSEERGPNAPRIPAPRPWTRSEEVRGLLCWRERCVPGAFVPRRNLSFHFCCILFLKGDKEQFCPQNGTFRSRPNTQYVGMHTCLLLHAGCISDVLLSSQTGFPGDI